MTIRKLYVGAHGCKPRYFIVNESGATVAYFDSLDEAGVVLRYLSGAPMLERDAEAARAAMQSFDKRKEG